MTVHIDFWVAWHGDRRAVRDFFFDAAKCNKFWVSPHELAYGRPDQQEREHYAVFNDYNIIDLNNRRFPEWSWGELPTNTHVWFTLNDSWKRDLWLDDCVTASIEWLARNEGDALLAVFECPLLARRNGAISVNMDAEPALGKIMSDEPRAKQLTELVLNTLQVECLPHELVALPPL